MAWDRSSSLVCVVLCSVAAVAMGAPTNYGDLNGIHIIFEQVTESSLTDPVPLFGTPTAVGDVLQFDPTQFTSSSTGGGSDSTDGTLTMTIVGTIAGTTLRGVSELTFNEHGDYSLLGPPGLGTASVAASVHVEIQEVDQEAITPVVYDGLITLTPSGGTFEIPADQGGTVGWDGELVVDVSQLLTDEEISGVASRVYIELTNQLSTSATHPSVTSTISKKNMGNDVSEIAVGIIPEPATLSLLALGGVALLRRRK